MCIISCDLKQRHGTFALCLDSCGIMLSIYNSVSWLSSVLSFFYFFTEDYPWVFCHFAGFLGFFSSVISQLGIICLKGFLSSMSPVSMLAVPISNLTCFIHRVFVFSFSVYVRIFLVILVSGIFIICTTLRPYNENTTLACIFWCLLLLPYLRVPL